MAYVGTCAHIFERKVQKSQCRHLPFCGFWKEVECSETSCHKHSIHSRRKEYPYSLEMEGAVQCDTQASSVLRESRALLTDLPILL